MKHTWVKDHRHIDMECQVWLPVGERLDARTSSSSTLPIIPFVFVVKRGPNRWENDTQQCKKPKPSPAGSSLFYGCVSDSVCVHACVSICDRLGQLRTLKATLWMPPLVVVVKLTTPRSGSSLKTMLTCLIRTETQDTRRIYCSYPWLTVKMVKAQEILSVNWPARYQSTLPCVVFKLGEIRHFFS